MRSHRWTCAVIAALVLVAPVLAQVGTPLSPNDFVKKIWRMPDDKSSLAVRLVFGMSEINCSKHQIDAKWAPPWTFSTMKGDAAVLQKAGARFSLKKDYPETGGETVKHADIADYVQNYRYDTSNDANFQASRAELIKFADEHRTKRFFSAGLPFFAVPFGPQSGNRVKSFLSLFDRDPMSPLTGQIKNGVVDMQALVDGVLDDCYRTTSPGFLTQNKIERKTDDEGNVWYKFDGSDEEYRFETYQVFLFQKDFQGTPLVGTPNLTPDGKPAPSRFTTTENFTGWNRPEVKEGSTAFDTLTDEQVSEMKNALGSMVSSGKYIVKGTNGATVNGATPDFKKVDLAKLETWTVTHRVDAMDRFDPSLEGAAQAEKRAKTSLAEIQQAWMEVVTYVHSKVISKSGTTVEVGPYMYTQYVYVNGGLSYVPKSLEQAKMVKGVEADPPPYQGTDGDYGIREFATPNINVTFGNKETEADFERPVQMYRGFPKLGTGERLVGADDNGKIDLSDQVNQESTMCMNMAISLSTRYRYNPNPAAPPPPEPPADPALHQAWLDQHFPVCISYYPPFKNNKGKIIGPYARLAGPIGGGGACEEFRDDRYAACVKMPGTQVTVGTLYKPIRFEGKLLEVVNLLVLPKGHPNRPDEDYTYNVGALAARNYPFAWRLDFDPSNDLEDQGVSNGFPCEVIRIPMFPPNLTFESEFLPIDPRIPTMEQRDADGMVHKAMMDAKLKNGPDLGRLGSDEPNTNQPGYGRNNFIYAVVGQCCGPTVLLQATMAQGNRVDELTIGGQKVRKQIGVPPNCILVVSSEQSDKEGAKQEEALGIPAGFEAPSTPDFGTQTGSPALKGKYRMDSISSRAGDDYIWGAYSNLAYEIGFDKGAASVGNAKNPADAKGKSFLEAQGVYFEGQRYFLDVCAETAVAPQMVKDEAGSNLIAYFVKEMKLEIVAPGPDGKTAPNGQKPELSQVIYKVPSLREKAPTNPPCYKQEFVPRQIGEYTLVTTITDFNDVTRVTRMKLPVRETGTSVDALNRERERK